MKTFIITFFVSIVLFIMISSYSVTKNGCPASSSQGRVKGKFRA